MTGKEIQVKMKAKLVSKMVRVFPIKIKAEPLNSDRS